MNDDISTDHDHDHDAAPAPDADRITGDVEEQVQEETDQGFLGTKVDPRPNEDYTLTTGPDAPPAHEDDRSRSEQRAAGQED